MDTICCAISAALFVASIPASFVGRGDDKVIKPYREYALLAALLAIAANMIF